MMHCENTLKWINSIDHRMGCDVYEQRFCLDGEVRPGSEHAMGAYWNWPEKNCCECGKPKTVWKPKPKIHYELEKPPAYHCVDTPNWRSDSHWLLGCKDYEARFCVNG